MLSPSVPIRSVAEKNALLNGVDALSLFHDSYASLRLISPGIVASNETSQFRLLILDENKGRVEVRRSGQGWGRDLTVAAVAFTLDSDFMAFKEMGSFSIVKQYLTQSILQQKEVVFRSDSQVPILPSSESTVESNSNDEN